MAVSEQACLSVDAIARLEVGYRVEWGGRTSDPLVKGGAMEGGAVGAKEKDYDEEEMEVEEAVAAYLGVWRSTRGAAKLDAFFEVRYCDPCSSFATMKY